VSFSPFGIRLRPGARVFASLMPRNRSPAAATFVVRWVIEYELLPAGGMADPRAGVIVSVHADSPVFNNAVLTAPAAVASAKDTTEASTEAPGRAFELAWTLALHKDVTVRKVYFRRHGCLERVAIDGAGQRLWALDAAAGAADGEAGHVLESPVRLAAGVALEVTAAGRERRPTEHVRVSLLVTCDDGADHLADLVALSAPTAPRTRWPPGTAVDATPSTTSPFADDDAPDLWASNQALATKSKKAFLGISGSLSAVADEVELDPRRMGTFPNAQGIRRAGVLKSVTALSVDAEDGGDHVLDNSCQSTCSVLCGSGTGCVGCGKGCQRCGVCVTCTICTCPSGQYNPNTWSRQGPTCYGCPSVHLSHRFNMRRGEMFS
jgi:hypothetical protein